MVKLTWNVADPRGRVCRIRRTPAARRKEHRLRWPLTARDAVEGTHESQGTPQAQGLSVPSSFAAVKTNGVGPHRYALHVKPLRRGRSSISQSAHVKAQPGMPHPGARPAPAKP